VNTPTGFRSPLSLNHRPSSCSSWCVSSITLILKPHPNPNTDSKPSPFLVLILIRLYSSRCTRRPRAPCCARSTAATMVLTVRVHTYTHFCKCIYCGNVPTHGTSDVNDSTYPCIQCPCITQVSSSWITTRSTAQATPTVRSRFVIVNGIYSDTGAPKEMCVAHKRVLYQPK